MRVDMDIFVHTLAVLGLVTPFLAIFFIWDRKRVGERLREIEHQVGTVQPYWQAMQKKLIVDLTHPHKEATRVDELLRRLRDNPKLEMTPADRAELLEGLAKRAAGDDIHISESERRKAKIFPLVMEEVQDEAANPNPLTGVITVGVKKPEDT